MSESANIRYHILFALDDLASEHLPMTAVDLHTFFAGSREQPEWTLAQVRIESARLLIDRLITATPHGFIITPGVNPEDHLPPATVDPQIDAQRTGLLKFIHHDHNCDILLPNWHQGPCDCGLEDAIAEIEDPKLLAALKEASPGVFRSAESFKWTILYYLHKEWGEPTESFADLVPYILAAYETEGHISCKHAEVLTSASGENGEYFGKKYPLLTAVADMAALRGTGER